MLKPLLPAFRGLLRESGYEVLTRSNAWSECLVEREGERWEGRGRDADEALADAIRQMFPSALAKSLAHARVAGIASGVVETAAPHHAPLPPPAIAGGSSLSDLTELAVSHQASSHDPNQASNHARMTGATLLSMGTSPRAGLLAPIPESGERAVEPPPASVAAPTSSSAVTANVPPPPPSVPASPRAPAITLMNLPRASHAVAEAASDAAPASSHDTHERPTRPRIQETVGAVDQLVAEIEERLARLARMSADQQRLHIMVWICRARAFEEAAQGARDVEQAVARVARRLTEIGKMLWPGSVRALQLSARPADVRRELHASWAQEPANWREATTLAERLLHEHAHKCAELGFDDDGWADGALRGPPPPDADAVLEAADAEMHAILATIEGGSAATARPGELSSTDQERLLTIARKLRWVRGAVKSDLTWGSAVGRLRRALSTLGDRAIRVRDVLDARTKPAVAWGKLLGAAVEEPRLPPAEDPEQLKSELMDAQKAPEGLVAWLIRAVDVLNTPELVALMVPLRADLERLGDETLNHSDRRVRRRLRELVRRVTGSPDAPQETPKSGEISHEDEVASEENIGSRMLDELAARVRQRTAGRRVLFVSNREDPDLDLRLSELLGIEITWCDGSLRRVQAQCERIKGGSYDLVLSATGFQVHGVDAAVSRAAGAAHVPYVRVNRGRPVACVQAIAREFGLSPSAAPSSTNVLRAASDE